MVNGAKFPAFDSFKSKYDEGIFINNLQTTLFIKGEQDFLKFLDKINHYCVYKKLKEIKIVENVSAKQLKIITNSFPSVKIIVDGTLVFYSKNEDYKALLEELNAK